MSSFVVADVLAGIPVADMDTAEPFPDFQPTASH
jgi:hypothetical protein